MRSLSLNDRLKSIQKAQIANQISTFYNTVATIDSGEQLNENLKDKIRTFTRWRAAESLPKKKKKQLDFSLLKQNTDMKTPVNHLLGLIIEQVKEKQKKASKKKTLVVQELEGIKTDRRERFKRLQNPQQIIIHYVKHQGFKPSRQEQTLLYRIVKLKTKLDSIQPFNLEIALQHIVKTMNMAVDFNSTYFLILLIMMAGEISFEAKQMKTAFFFFTQAIVASTCTMLWTTKLEALVYLGKICLEVMEYQNSILFFKKALQYAWKVSDREIELRIYDFLGQAHYFQGKCESATYYHNRYILGQNAKKVSAVLRMSAQMLKQYEKTIDNTEKENLSQLFLNYLRLPITNFSFYPPMRVEEIPENYVNDTSPRKNRKDFQFNYKDLPQTKFQIQKVLKQFNDFRSQIPNPDLYRNFVPTQKYGKHRKNVQFQQSHDYHKIFGVKMKQFDKSILKLPIDEKIESIMADKPKRDWWEQILMRSKKQRSQKMGGIRNKVYKRHESYEESEKVKIENKRRQAISQSMNKTILNWIDPPKKNK